MTEKGSAHRSGLGRFFRMKNGIFGAFSHFPKPAKLDGFWKAPFAVIQELLNASVVDLRKQVQQLLEVNPKVAAPEFLKWLDSFAQ